MVGILPFFFTRNRSKYFLLLTIVAFSFHANAQSFYFKSHQSGNWNAAATWESSPDGVTWTTPAVTTPGAAINNSTSVLILSGHTVTISANVANPVAGGSNVGTVTVQGTLTNSGTRTINLAGATLDNQGTINLAAGTVTISGTPFSITSGGGTPSTSFSTLSIANGANVTVGIALTTSGTLTVGAAGGAASLITNAGITSNGAVTISGTGSSMAANNSPISVAGTLTVNTGNTFTTDNSASAILNGNLTANGTFTSNAPVIFSGAATQTLAGTNATFNSDVTVTNASANGLVGTGSPTFKGNLINNGKIGFTAGTATFSGASPQTISGASGPTTKFYALTVSSGSSLTVDVTIPTIQIAGTSLAAIGTFSSNAPVTFNRVGATALTGAGATFNSDVSVVSGTTLNGAGSFSMNGSQLANDGTITSTGTVTFGSSGGTTLSTTTAPKTFSFATIVLNNNVTLGSSGITLKSTAASPSAGLTMNSGTLKLSGGTLTVGTGLISITSGVIDATVASTITIGATGTLTGTMTFTDGSSITNFTVARSITMQGNVTVNTLALNTAGTVVTQLSGTFTIANNGSITSAGGKLSLASPIIAAGVYDLSYTIAAALTTGDELSSNSSAIQNFTKAGTSILTLNKALTVNNTFSLSAGTLTASGNAVTLNGTTNTIAATAVSNFAALNVNGPLIKSSTGGTTITGDVALGTGGSIDFTTGGVTTFTTNTTLSNVGSGSIAFNALNVTTTAGALKASAPFSVAGVFTVNNPGSFTANAGADVTLSNSLAGSGAFTSNAKVIFNTLTTISNSGAKTFTDISVSGTVNVTANVTSTVNGNLVNDGTINCSSGTWAFGGNSKTISGTSPTATNFFNLTIKDGASISTSIPFTTAGALNIVAATGIAGVASLTTTAGFTANGAVNVFGTGSNFNANTGAFSVAGTLTLGTGNFFTIDATSIATMSGNLISNSTFANNGTLTVGANLTGTGSLDQGTNATLNIGGTSTITNLSATATGNTVNYTGSGQTVKGVNYYNLSLSGTALAAVGLTIVGDVTIGSGATFTAGAVIHNVVGNWTNNGTFTNSGGTVVLNGSGLQTIGGVNSTTFYNLTLSGSTKTFGISTTVSGSLAISTGAKANLSSSHTYTAGTLTLGGVTQISGTYGSSISAAPPANQNNTYFAGDGVVGINNNIFYSITMGSWAAPATWSTGGHAGTSGSAYPQAGDIAVIGSSHTVTVTGTQACETLSFDGAGTVSINSGDTLAVSGDITGTGTSTGSFIAVASTGLLQVGGTLSSASGTFTPTLPANSTVEFNGIGAQTVPAFTYGNLTLSGSGNRTMAGSFNIGGDLNIDNGVIFTMGAFTTTITGTTTVNGTLSIASTTGTKIFAGLVTINSGATWNNSANESFTFRGGITNNGGTFIGGTTGAYLFNSNAQALTGTLTIPAVTVTAITLTNNNVLTVGTLGGSGTLAQAASAILNIAGTSGITTLDASATGNNVNYTGVVAQTVHIGNYYNLNLSGAGTKALPAGTTSVGNSLTVTGGELTNNGTLTVTGALSGTGTLTQAASATLNIGGTSAITNLSASASGNTVNYTGTGQTVNGVNYNNLSLSGSGAVILQASTTSISGDLSLSGTVSTTGVIGLTIGGDVNIGSGTSFTSGAFTHNVGGNWTNNGTFTHSGGTVALMGAGKTIGGGSTTFNNLTLSLNANQTLNLLNSVNLAGILNITNDNNSVQSSGNLTLLSTASGTASIGSLAGTNRTVLGSVKVQRYFGIADNFDRFFSSPVATASVAQLQAASPAGSFLITGSFPESDYPANPACLNNNPTLRYYREAVGGALNNGYQNWITSNTNTLEVGIGYDAYMWNGIYNTTVTFQGIINSGDIPLGIATKGTGTTLTRTTSNNVPAADGWNLVGNPYPSAIQWNGGTGWAMTNIDPTVWVWDVIGRVWYSYNYTSSVGTLANGIIASGQGFWVYVTGPGSTGSITIKEQAKSPSVTASYFRTEKVDYLEISLSGSGTKESSFLMPWNNAAEGADHLNSVKPEFGFEKMSIALLSQDIKYGHYAQASKDEVIPLYINVEDADNYAISFGTERQGSDLENYYLVDMDAKSFIQARSGSSYNFNVTEDQKSHAASRFYLTKNPDLLLKDVEKELTVRCYPNPTSRQITIEINSEAVQDVSIFNITGSKLARIDLQTGNGRASGKLDISELSPGIYMIRGYVDGKVFVERIIKY